MSSKNSTKEEMVLTTVLPDLKRHLKYVSALHCIPLAWDYKKGIIVSIKTPFSTISHRLGNCVYAVYLFYQLVSMFRNRIGNEEVQSVDRFLAGLIVSMYAACIVVSFEFELDFTPMEILNRIISGKGKNLIFLAKG